MRERTSCDDRREELSVLVIVEVCERKDELAGAAVLLLERSVNTELLFPSTPRSRCSGEGMSPYVDESECRETQESVADGSVIWESAEGCLYGSDAFVLLKKNIPWVLKRLINGCAAVYSRYRLEIGPSTPGFWRSS